MSTLGLRAHLITHLLTFTPVGGGNTIGARLGDRLYPIRPPDDAAFPHGCLRLTGRESTGDDSDIRSAGRIELQLFGKKLVSSIDLEYCGDVAEAALWKYSADVFGQFDVRGLITRDEIDPPPAPADRAITQVRLLWSFTWWPDHRAQSAVLSGSAP